MRYYIERNFPSLFDFDNFFNDFFESSSDRFPPVDVYETDQCCGKAEDLCYREAEPHSADSDQRTQNICAGAEDHQLPDD